MHVHVRVSFCNISISPMKPNKMSEYYNPRECSFLYFLNYNRFFRLAAVVLFCFILFRISLSSLFKFTSKCFKGRVKNKIGQLKIIPMCFLNTCQFVS